MKTMMDNLQGELKKVKDEAQENTKSVLTETQKTMEKLTETQKTMEKFMKDEGEEEEKEGEKKKGKK